MVGAGERHMLLTRYSIEGVVWGLEYLWLDETGRMAMFHVRRRRAVDQGRCARDLVPAYDALMSIAAQAAMADLEADHGKDDARQRRVVRTRRSDAH